MARQWLFVSNMNGDGIFTISDVGAWIGWLFFYPGDLVIYGILSFGQLARFFEVTPAHYGGLFSFLFGLAIWPIPLLVLFIGRFEEWYKQKQHMSRISYAIRQTISEFVDLQKETHQRSRESQTLQVQLDELRLMMETHEERYSSNQKTIKEALEGQDRLVKVDVTVDDLKLIVDRTSSDVRSLIHVSKT